MPECDSDERLYPFPKRPDEGTAEATSDDGMGFLKGLDEVKSALGSDAMLLNPAETRVLEPHMLRVNNVLLTALVQTPADYLEANQDSR
jgi:hypothetical protein